MEFRGKVHKLGAHIDTDAIIPARYLVTTDVKELGNHCMAGLDPNWTKRVSPGDIIVAGPNFGCGSSREHAPLAILGAGIPIVIAHSFARIFYRNAFNMGLPLVEIGNMWENIDDGDELLVNLVKGKLQNLTKNQIINTPKLPDFMLNLLKVGGLIEYVKNKIKGN
ncbi:3-isopropylmalate dehydratase small subunit [Desulfothermus okinawensis JCM 13304]